MTALLDPETLVEPAFMTGPDWHDTLGGEVAEMCAGAGYGPNPEQRLILDHQFGYDLSGKFTAFEVVLIGCRQNFKTGVLKMGALGKAFLLRRPLVVWSAHEFDTAGESFLELKTLVESHPDFDRRVFKIFEGKGSEEIRLKGPHGGPGGPRIIFKARTKVKGRGLAGDDSILDEGLFLRAVHMGALVPIMSTRANPQITYAGSAGLAASAYWRGLRDRGRAGSPRLFYIEYSAERLTGHDEKGRPTYGLPPCLRSDCDHALDAVGCVFDDRALLKAANPSAGRALPPAISWEYLADERRSLSADPEARHEYARERLGRWDEPAHDDRPVAIDPEQWAGLADETAAEPTRGWVFLTVSPDRQRATIALAAGPRRRPVVMVRTRLGTEWVARRVKRMIDRRVAVGVALNGASAASVLLNDLTAAGVKYVDAPNTEGQKACAELLSRVERGKLAHLGQPVLTQAAMDARLRRVGKAVEFDQTDPEAPDVSPLVAAAGALHRWLAMGDYDVSDSYL